MIESGYHPPGAEFDSRAPWNEITPPEEEFDITITQTLSKTVTVVTDEYELIIEHDEDGGYRELNTEDTDWKDVYEREHHTPAQLISILKRILETGEELSPRLKEYIIEDCENWCVDDYEISE